MIPVPMIIERLSGSFLNNTKLFALTLLFAIPLGLLISFGTRSRFALLRCPIKVFVWIIRGTPLMLQLFIIYFGPPLITAMIQEYGIPFPIINWPSSADGRFIAATVAFVINYACYFSEIFRGGINSIPKGQYEAGQVLGMTKPQIFFRVTLLQVFQRIIPPIGNEVITLVKDTALANVLSIKEIIMMAGEYTARGLIWPLFATGIYFLLFVGILTLLFGWLEKKLNYFKA